MKMVLSSRQTAIMAFAVLIAVNVGLLFYMYEFLVPPQEAAYEREQRRRQYFPQKKKRRR